MPMQVEIFGVPMDLGANLRGVDMGPSALRIAGIGSKIAALGHELIDRGEISLKSRVTLPKDGGSAKYIDEIVEVCLRLHDVAMDTKERGALPVFLGGDHSIAAGTIAGVASHYRKSNEKLGVIWFDAHTDMNTPATSPSGNVHGMPLASLLGYGSEALNAVGGDEPCIDAKNVFVIGARDVDDSEKEMVARSGINVFSMKEIDRLGMAEVTKRAIEGAAAGTAGIHLSFDIDGLDPIVAPGVGTPVRGGISFREAHLFMELLADSKKLTSMDIVELNPVEDVRNQTADAVVHLIQSAFGRRII